MTSVVTKQRMIILIAVTCLGLSLHAAETSHRVRATLLERESSVRTSVNNHDVYRIEILTKKGGRINARMIDDFPGYAEPIPDELRNGAIFSVELRRTSFCDENNGGFGVGPVGENEAGLRCFTVVHGSWKSARGVKKDEWWK
jgi:hypothetical protein